LCYNSFMFTFTTISTLLMKFYYE